MSPENEMGHVRWGRNGRPDDQRSIRNTAVAARPQTNVETTVEGAPRARSRPVRIGETRQDLLAGYCCGSVVNETPTSPPGRGDGHVDVDRVDPDVHLGYAEVSAHIAQVYGRGG